MSLWLYRGLGWGNRLYIWIPLVISEALGSCQFFSLEPNSLSPLIFRCWSWGSANHFSALPVAFSAGFATRGQLWGWGWRAEAPFSTPAAAVHASSCQGQCTVFLTLAEPASCCSPMRHSSPQLWPLPHGPSPTSWGLFSKCYLFLLFFQS